MKCYCAVCGIKTVTRVPPGGDGSLLYPRKHLIKGTSVTCLGSWEEAEERSDRPKKKRKNKNHEPIHPKV